MNNPRTVCQEEIVERLKRENKALRQRVVTLKRKNTRLAKRSMTDKLTGLANRRAFEAAHLRESARQGRSKRPLVIALFDLDHFKRVNDTYGHAAGDRVLRRFARVLKASVRETDLAARYGGEEFAIIMPEMTPESAVDAIERIRAATGRRYIKVGAQIVRFTVSIGVAVQAVGDAPRAVLEQADQALYRAKENGRNCVELAR